MTARRDPQPGPAHPDQRSEEALERTLLADDRTLLAWYRAAFGAYALAVGLGSVLPSVSQHASSFYKVIGVAFAVLGAIAPLAGSWSCVVGPGG